MDYHEREALAARVASGTVRLRVLNEFDRPVAVVLRPPSREDRYAAQEAYREVYEDAALDGCYSEAEVLDFLTRQKLWDAEREAEAAQLQKDIEEFKTKLVLVAFRAYERKKAKLALNAARDRHRELTERKHSYDHLTCHGVANMARTRFLVGCSLHHARGGRVVPPDAFEGNPSGEGCSVVFDNAVEAFVAGRVPDAALRELARTEPWRSVWSAGKNCGSVFGVPSADLTEEQLRLSVWTQVYDHIMGHPECPADEVLDDDDMADGWLILQRRKRDREATERKADGVAGDKVRDAEQVFLLADDAEDARRIEEMNDAQALAVKRQREALLRQRGVVDELDMPDTKMRLHGEVRQMMAAARGK